MIMLISELPEDTPHKVRKIKQILNISAATLASNTGYTRGYVNMILNNHRPVTESFIYKLCEYLQVSIDIFYIQKKYDIFIKKLKLGVDK